MTTGMSQKAMTHLGLHGGVPMPSAGALSTDRLCQAMKATPVTMTATM